MTLQVRDARPTDGRITSFVDRMTTAHDLPVTHRCVDSHLLRRLVDLPSASVFVALAGPDVARTAVVVLRPSVTAGDFIGTLDLFMVDPALDDAGVGRALLEVRRTARDKGCPALETPPVGDADERERWADEGFRHGEARMACDLPHTPSARSRYAGRAPQRAVSTGIPPAHDALEAYRRTT